MSQLAIFETSDLTSTNLSKLSKFLGSPFRTIESKNILAKDWGRLGGSQLTINYVRNLDQWDIFFHIFTDKTSYRKNLIGVDFNVAQAWLEANAEFIMENMKREA